MPEENHSKRLIKHLDQKWGDRPCPMCGGNNWDIASISELKQYIEEGFDTSATVLPIIPVICRNCGNTILVNAMVAGVIKSKKGVKNE